MRTVLLFLAFLSAATAAAAQPTPDAFPRLDEGWDDAAFCQRVIREAGVVIVPGSGFGQKPGTQHFRVVFLPPEDVLERAFDGIARIGATM